MGTRGSKPPRPSSKPRFRGIELTEGSAAIADKPAVVLVRGFWGNAGHWGKVISELSSRGYASLHAVENPLTSPADDAERTGRMVNQIDGPVVLVGHSCGGGVTTESGDLPNVQAANGSAR